MPADAAKCALCLRPAPASDTDDELNAMIDAGWTPYYYVGQLEMPGPICPDCRCHNLRLGEDGEWESIIPRAVGSDPDSFSQQA